MTATTGATTMTSQHTSRTLRRRRNPWGPGSQRHTPRPRTLPGRFTPLARRLCERKPSSTQPRSRLRQGRDRRHHSLAHPPCTARLREGQPSRTDPHRITPRGTLSHRSRQMRRALLLLHAALTNSPRSFRHRKAASTPTTPRSVSSRRGSPAPTHNRATTRSRGWKLGRRHLKTPDQQFLPLNRYR
jgi:hypothetical protein